jgi:GT2 family glycosyltransferase
LREVHARASGKRGLVDYPRERLELHLVDNGAGDGTLAAAKKGDRAAGHEACPSVVIHEPGSNVGFAVGNNIACALPWSAAWTTAFCSIPTRPSSLRL